MCKVFGVFRGIRRARGIHGAGILSGMSEACLCPKGVAEILGVSRSTAARLMVAGEIRSFRVRPRLLRTTREQVELYKQRELALGAKWIGPNHSSK
jgi:excisionase family DNA binding protein